MVATSHAGVRNFLLLTATAVSLAAGCTPVPRVELTAYTTAYSDGLEATNGVLDIIVPYERVVMRLASGDTASLVSTPRAAGASPPPIEGRRSPARPLPPPDPSLFADPNAVRSTQPRPPPDPALFANPNSVKSVKPAPPLDPPPAAPMGAVTTVSEGGCDNGIGGADPFCYELRDAWADIGDPPLVAAYRSLSNVVLRFNNLLVAYANGISGTLLEQDVNSLSAAAGGLTQLAPIAAIGGAGGFAAGFSGVVSALAPIAGIAGRIADRAQLRDFLLNNYENVDKAIALMATGSAELYANVAIGTNLFRRMTAPGAGQSLVVRRQEIRRLIANWTVLLDDNRRLLRELRAAAAAPDGLETRLNNLDPSVKARTDTSVIKKQIATLGTPLLAP
jgi:hypothetical protein